MNKHIVSVFDSNEYGSWHVYDECFNTQEEAFDYQDILGSMEVYSIYSTLTCN
jgi:hypothetical protein